MSPNGKIQGEPEKQDCRGIEFNPDNVNHGSSRMVTLLGLMFVSLVFTILGIPQKDWMYSHELCKGYFHLLVVSMMGLWLQDWVLQSVLHKIFSGHWFSSLLYKSF